MENQLNGHHRCSCLRAPLDRRQGDGDNTYAQDGRVGACGSGEGDAEDAAAAGVFERLQQTDGAVTQAVEAARLPLKKQNGGAEVGR